MNFLSCADITIPLPLVSSVSWTKTAKTVQKKGGAIVSRGFEPAEISVRAGINCAVCAAFGLDFGQWAETLRSLAPGRLSPSGTMRVAGFAIYPELEFALTNANRTIQADECGTVSAIEVDLVFSGVSVAKEVSRERALQMDRATEIPKVTLSVGDRSLSVQDGLALVEFVTEPDAIHLLIECGSDMDLVSRDGFLEKLSEGGRVIAELPTGTTEFHVVMAYLMSEQLSIDGSIYPQQSQQSISKTYTDCDISDIFGDLCDLAGIPCDCRASGQIDYYRANGTPLDCIRDLMESAGMVASYRQGRATFAFLPGEIVASYSIEYLSMDSDSDAEPVSGCLWYDGVNLHVTGAIDGCTVRILSKFRAENDFSAQCLALARYRRHRIVVTCDVDPRIDSHSVVSVASNDAAIDCLVDWFSTDWINNAQELELCYL